MSHPEPMRMPVERWGDLPKEMPEPPAMGVVVGYTTELDRRPTEDDLPDDDGIPMPSEEHHRQMELLVYSLRPWLQRRQATGEGEGGYVAGDMFVYFDLDEDTRSHHCLGPDVMVVLGAETRKRKSWLVWEEGKAPDVAIELLSDSSRTIDKIEKKAAYQDRLKTPAYYWFDPMNPADFAGFELRDGRYEALAPDADGRLACNVLGLRLGTWHGRYCELESVWLRWYTNEGELIPTYEEIQARRADEATRRVAVLEQRLRALGFTPDEEREPPVD